MRGEKFTIYRDTVGDWRWRCIGRGGRVLADSGQGYADKRDCVRGLEITTGGWYELGFQQRTPDGCMYQQGVLRRTISARRIPDRTHTYEAFVEVLP